MRRFIAVLAVIALTGTIAFANAEGAQFGIRAGFNMNKISTFDESDIDLDMGKSFGAGFLVKFPLTSQLSFVPEANFYYGELGGFRMNFFGVDIRMAIKEVAVSVPIMFQLRPFENSSFYLASGVQADIPLSTKAVIKMSYAGESESESENMDDRSSADIGIPLGIGFMIKPSWGVDFRYIINLTKPFDEEENGKIKLARFGFGMTYLF